MATIERKPLPPPNSKAMTITEADGAEMVGHANAVIDYYLNGPGSYWAAGPRKPLVSGDERGDSTFRDLKRFKDNLIASKQFAEDPNSIIGSIIGLIDHATDQVEQAARNNEGKDDISRPPPDTNDPINDPRVISPRFLNNAALPIGLKVELPAPQVGGTHGIPNREPIRFLSRRTVNQSLPPAFAPSVVAEPDPGEMATGPADAQRIRVLSRRVVPRNDAVNGNFSPPGISNRVVPSSQPARPLGLFTGEPMPQWPVPPPI